MNTDTPVLPPSLRETLSSLTPEDRAAFALSSDDWNRRAHEAEQRGHLSTATTFRAVARVADSVARKETP